MTETQKKARLDDGKVSISTDSVPNTGMDFTPFSAYRSTAYQDKTNVRFPVQMTVKTLDDLKILRQTDHTTNAFNGTACKANWTGTDCLFLDVDNSATDDPSLWINPQDVMTAFPDVECAIIPSRNHMVEKNGQAPRPKFHCYFPLKDTLTDRQQRDDLTAAIVSHWTYPTGDLVFDDGAMDSARKVFGADPEREGHAVDDPMIITGSMSIAQYMLLYGGRKRETYSPGQTSYAKGKGPAWDGESPIPEGSRHGTTIAYMGWWIKRNVPSPAEITDELNRVLEHWEGTCDDKERHNLLSSCLDWPERLKRDPNYIPDWKAYQKDRKQRFVESGEVMQTWDGMTPDHHAIVRQINADTGRYMPLIQHFNGSEQRKQEPVGCAERDIKSLVYAAKSAMIPAKSVPSVLLSMYHQSAVYKRSQAQLDPILEEMINRQCADMVDDRTGLPTFKGERGQFMNEAAAQAFMDTYPCRYHSPSGQLCVFLNGMFTFDENTIQREMVERFIAGSRKSQRQEILESLKVMAPVIDCEAPSHLLSFRNGVLNMETGEFTEGHGSDMVFLNTIPHDYVPDPEPVNLVDKTLDQWSCGDPIVKRNMLEMIGACLYRGAPLQVFFCLTGEGANGKSVMLDLMNFVLGESNVSNIPIEKLEDRFSVVRAFGKLANLAAENEPRYVKKTANLKMMATGDKVQGEEKQEHTFFFPLTATGVFSFNELPRFCDPTGAVTRRIVTIPFNATFTGDESRLDPQRHVYPSNPWALKELTTEESAQYLISLSLTAFRQAMMAGKIVTSERGQAQIEEMDEHRNQCRRFLTYMQEVNETYPVGHTCKSVYDDYMEWSISERIDTRYRLQPISLGKQISRLAQVKSVPRKECIEQWVVDPDTGDREKRPIKTSIKRYVKAD